MTFFHSIFLGILQGLTEFLPVSSSGHLVIAQELIPSFEQPGVLFDVVLHAGTLIAILFFFRKKILSLSQKYLAMLIIGTIPAVFVGIFFSSYIENLFTSLTVVGFALLLTAVMNFMTDKGILKKVRKIGPNKGLPLSLIIGVFQAFAIVPGISRSGATIFAGSKFGFTKKQAAEFSFLLSVPAVFGANVLQFSKYGGDNNINIFYYLIGFLAAFISGYLAIGFVIKTLLAKKFKYFAVYCAVVGLTVTLLI
jgi:undecaprenyl-diphosphatase